MDKHDTVMMLGAAIHDLDSVRSSVWFTGRNSDHVQQARFDQFVRSIDGVIDGLAGISGMIEGEIVKEREQKFIDRMAKDDIEYWKED